MPRIERKEFDARLFAGALIASTGLQLVELLLPRIPIIPWLRPGFSWIVLLPFLLDFGVAPTLALFLSRNLLSMAFGGQPASTFLISSVSGCAAILAIGPILRLLVGRGWLGRGGASILLASAFNALQLLLVAEVLVGSRGYFAQIGPLLLWSAFSGLLVGWLSLPLGEGRGWDPLSRLAPAAEGRNLPKGSTHGSLFAALAMTGSLVAQDMRILASGLLLSLIWGRRTALRAILQTWPFLPYLAWFHLRGTPGELLAGGWITREGLAHLLEQTLRLWTFTSFGRILTHHLPWNRLLRIDTSWTRGFALALPRMAYIFPAALGAARSWWKAERHSGHLGLLNEFASRLDDPDERTRTE